MASPAPEFELYRLRPAAPGDVDDITAIEEASFPVPWKRQFFEGELHEAHPPRYHRVLERQLPGLPRIAAYLFAVMLFDEFHVNKIATHPVVRKEGHGRRMMRDAIDAARERRSASIVLEVRLTNEEAIRFYRGFGFIEVGRRKHYYKDGEDARVMMLPLSDDPFGA
ncbi:MAG TPA: ribosomal protein S18-alanine N-acetyltransferase [Thermoanaerobaculia bacterium]|jgi:ribosomal-protein-alanine N-acetyltransferase|nr:ribosomal protein S18-alanine N-acetyltransferase [Thermoanaerobaculia bacterium]